jgi:uncharacterized protein YuzE
MRLKFDLNVGALYIRLSDQPVARTREIDDNTNVDVDVDGGVVGIEVISTSHPWPLADILATFPIPAGEATQLRSYFYLSAPEAARAVMRSPAMPAPPTMGFATPPASRALVAV